MVRFLGLSINLDDVIFKTIDKKKAYHFWNKKKSVFYIESFFVDFCGFVDFTIKFDDELSIELRKNLWTFCGFLWIFVDFCGFLWIFEIFLTIKILKGVIDNHR